MRWRASAALCGGLLGLKSSDGPSKTVGVVAVNHRLMSKANADGEPADSRFILLTVGR
jgi:hypothetical protein